MAKVQRIGGSHSFALRGMLGCSGLFQPRSPISLTIMFYHQEMY
jgi:hypothetical protein